jgi:hypothetical protein
VSLGYIVVTCRYVTIIERRDGHELQKTRRSLSGLDGMSCITFLASGATRMLEESCPMVDMSLLLKDELQGGEMMAL